MKAQIVITPEGKVMLVTREGDFEAGSKKIKALLEALKLQGLDISLEGPIEQHRHDDESAGTVSHQAHSH